MMAGPPPSPAPPPPTRPILWDAELTSARVETDTVRTFSFRPPPADLTFLPGQYLTLKLPEVHDPRGPSRIFSISSSPSEPDRVSVSTRIGPSPFKQRLFELQPGDRGEIRAPFGKFTLDPEHPAVLLGGGIGVTPYRSMIRDAIDHRHPRPIVLLYASRTPEEIVFRSELEAWAREWPAFRPIFFVSRPEAGATPWSGRTGRIDTSAIRAESEGLTRPHFYICGPAAMVEELRAALALEPWVPPDCVRTEVFKGY